MSGRLMWINRNRRGKATFPAIDSGVWQTFIAALLFRAASTKCDVNDVDDIVNVLASSTGSGSSLSSARRAAATCP
jgi:hypothetical protein